VRSRQENEELHFRQVSGQALQADDGHIFMVLDDRHVASLEAFRHIVASMNWFDGDHHLSRHACVIRRGCRHSSRGGHADDPHQHALWFEIHRPL
jgi:hypothetical protein